MLLSQHSVLHQRIKRELQRLRKKFFFDIMEGLVIVLYRFTASECPVHYRQQALQPAYIIFCSGCHSSAPCLNLCVKYAVN